MKLTLEGLRQAAIKAHKDGDQNRAARAYARYLAHVPSDAGVWSNLGSLQRKMGLHERALQSHRRAVDIAPDDIGFLNNLANTLSDIGRYDESLVIRRRILKSNPADLNQLAMVGRCLRGQGDYTAAAIHLEKALEDHPDDAELQIQLAFAQLAKGEYLSGFAAYEARWKAGELKPRNLNYPQWQGEDLKGKSITVLPEQGFGDAVLFMRFVPILKKLGAHVRVVAEKPMFRLFEGLPGADEVVLPDFDGAVTDYWVNMMDLAVPYFTEEGIIPRPTQLTVSDDSKVRARQIVAPFKDKLRIGVVWTGSTTYKGNAFRSFTHNEFLPMTDQSNVQLFSLYKGPHLKEYYEDGADAVIIDSASTDRDFADCAALMQEMDLVITSDTATAHVAASLSVPTWIILHWDPFWVWTHSGTTTDWYPTAKLFRQTTPLRWDGVMEEVYSALSCIEKAKA